MLLMIAVRSAAGVRRDGDGLPWIGAGLHADQLAITEHQAGLDAAVLVTLVQEAAQAARGFR